ncbi:MAG TPA: glycosyltransferase [Lacunisphaera sp.]|nr:glycosyltransferase [Lacunisphaera sp.]
MNCYNSEAYLREAINSVLAQQYPNWELIFWDNVSTDGSADVVGSFGDPRIHYFRADEHTNLGKARKLATTRAGGEFVMVLDCDDVLYPDAVATLVKALADPQFGFGYGGAEIIDASGKVLSTWQPSRGSGNLLEKNLRVFEIPIFCMMRRSALVRSGLAFDEKLQALEDYCLFMHLAAEYPAKVIPRVVAKYRVHDRALTNRAYEIRIAEREYALGLLTSRHPELKTKYGDALGEAYAQCDYYRAHLSVMAGKRQEAIAAVWKHAHRNYKYAGLALMLLLPFGIWRYFHRIRKYRLSTWRVLLGLQALPAS